jgi:hypothetical protein
MRAKAAMPSRQSYKPLSSELQMLKAKAAKGAAMCSHGAAAMLLARVAGVPRMVGGAAIRSCYAAGELLGRLRASVGWGDLYTGLNLGRDFFYRVRGRRDAHGAGGPRGHVSAWGGGGYGEKSPGGRSALPFFFNLCCMDWTKLS